MYDWVVFLHVLGGMTFMLAHGASAAVAFRIRKETEPERIRALLDLSAITAPILYLAMLLLLVAGIVGGFMGKWWGQGWIWVGLGVLIALFVWMGLYSQRNFSPLRKAAGLEYFQGMKDNPKPAEEPLSDDEIRAMAANLNPMTVTLVGYGAIVIILIMMVVKPF